MYYNGDLFRKKKKLLWDSADILLIVLHQHEKLFQCFNLSILECQGVIILCNKNFQNEH